MPPACATAARLRRWRAGGRLYEAGIDILAQQRFSTYVLWVLEGNERAIRFYRKRGWRLDGDRAKDIGGDFRRMLLTEGQRTQR